MSNESRESKSSADENLEVAEDALGTVRRLWDAMAGQRWRLVLVTISSVLYVAGTIGAVRYSADLVDLLWANIQKAWETGEAFSLNLENGGTQVLGLLPGHSIRSTRLLWQALPRS